MYRQEVYNVILAQLLEERGIASAPETIMTMGEGHIRRMPDVIVYFNGLRVVLEGEMATVEGAHTRALNSAGRRVEEAIAHIGVAVVYPPFEENPEFAKLKDCLASSEMEIATITESRVGEFTKSSVDGLRTLLENTYDQLSKEDVVARATAVLDGAAERFASVIVAQGVDMSRMAELLGIRGLPGPANEGEKELE